MRVTDVSCRTECSPPGALLGSWSDRPPGAFLAAELVEIDPAALSDDELVDMMAAWRRQASWAQAGELAAVAELARRRESGSLGDAEFTSAEVGLALTISPRSADAHLDLARALAERLPMTRRALAEGRIDLVKARLIVQGTRAVDDETAHAIESRVLPDAPALTPGRLRARVERAVLALDPSGAERRREASEADRRVECYDTGHGTAVFGGVHLPVGPAIAADSRVYAIAKALKTDGDTRTLGQLAADVFLSLLLGTHPASGLPAADVAAAMAEAALAARDASSGALAGVAMAARDASFGALAEAALAARGASSGALAGVALAARGASSGAPGSRPDASTVIRLAATSAAGTSTAASAGDASLIRAIGDRIGTVHLTVPLATLLGLSDEPGEAAGYGPLTAEIARQMAAAASGPTTRWCVTVTGSEGEPLHHGHPAYRPPAAMAHLVRTLQPVCCFPGCTRPSRACDLDHHVPYDQGGVTCPCNLQPLCRRHHRAKQAKGWNVVRRGDRLAWTTPAGKTYLADASRQPFMTDRRPFRRSPVEAIWCRCLLDLPHAHRTSSTPPR